MSHHHDRKDPRAHDEEPPKTAGGEVLHEVEEAETRVVGSAGRRDSDGEAADALSPNEDAQEDVKQSGH